MQRPWGSVCLRHGRAQLVHFSFGGIRGLVAQVAILWGPAQKTGWPPLRPSQISLFNELVYHSRIAVRLLYFLGSAGVHTLRRRFNIMYGRVPEQTTEGPCNEIGKEGRRLCDSGQHVSVLR
jgi:hypothetical protein